MSISILYVLLLEDFAFLSMRIEINVDVPHKGYMTGQCFQRRKLTTLSRPRKLTANYLTWHVIESCFFFIGYKTFQ